MEKHSRTIAKLVCYAQIMRPLQTRWRTESETASCDLRFTPSSSTRGSHNLAECQLLTSLQFQNGFNPVIGHDNHGATNTARELWNHTFVHSLQALLLQNLFRAIER